MNKWQTARIVLIAITSIIAFIDGIYFGVDELKLNTTILAFIFFVIALPLLIKIQCKAPYVNKKWIVPTFKTNFLKLGDPLHFFHMASFSLIFGGFAALLASLIFYKNVNENVIPLFCGLGLLVGIKITIWVCKAKYE